MRSPRTTLPVMQKGRPSISAASSTRPSAMARRMRVLEIRSPRSITSGTPQAMKPSSSPRPHSSSKVPSRRWPKVKLSPTWISHTRSRPQRNSRTNCRAGVRENSRVKRTTSMTAIPASASRRSFCAGVVMARGACSGRSTARGCGSKVTTAAATRSSRARATTRSRMAHWPRWTPSKFPMAATAPCGRSLLS